MQQRLGAQQAAAGAQVLDQVGVRVLDPAARTARCARRRCVEPHRVDDREPLLGAQAEVVLAEGDRGVHDARAVLGRDEVARQHGAALRAIGLRGDEGKRRLVCGAEHLDAREPVDDLDVIAQHALGERLGEHLAAGGPHVREVGIHRDGGVGRERPRCGRPDEQRVALAQPARRG